MSEKKAKMYKTAWSHEFMAYVQIEFAYVGNVGMNFKMWADYGRTKFLGIGCEVDMTEFCL